MDHFKLVDAKT